MKTVPKHIKEKCRRMANLCMAAQSLKTQVEKWCEKNGINTLSEEWEQNVRDELGGCDAVLYADEIEKLLNNN